MSTANLSQSPYIIAYAPVAPIDEASLTLQSFKIKYKTEVISLYLFLSSFFRCAETGSWLVNADSEIPAHSHMETLNCKRKSMYHLSTKLDCANNTTLVFTVHMARDANSFTQIRTSKLTIQVKTVALPKILSLQYINRRSLQLILLLVNVSATAWCSMKIWSKWSTGCVTPTYPTNLNSTLSAKKGKLHSPFITSFI